MMNSKNIVIGVAVAALVAGGAYFALGRGDDTSNSDTSTNTSVSTEQASSDAPSFSPKSTENISFSATFESEGEKAEDNLVGTLKNDGKGSFQFSATTADSGEVEMYMLSDGSVVSCQSGLCFKSPVNTQTDIDRSDFTLSDDEISKYQSTANYDGTASCPAGTCNVWSYTDEEGALTKVFVSRDTNLVSKLEASDAASKISMVFTYEDVTITVPANVQEIPTE